MPAIGAVERGDWSSDMNGGCITEASFYSNSTASLWPAHESPFDMLPAIDEASYYSSELHRFSHSGGLLMDPHPYIFSFDLCLENTRSKHPDYRDGSERIKRIDSESEVLQNSKKRSLSLKNASKPMNSRSNKRSKSMNEEDRNEDKNNGQSTSNFNSEDESNTSQESIPRRHKSLDLAGKTRAARGSATDPQSLYARKRRERINQRLRTLQGLVPNGTKVDISTMLEEAVQYVKFLQLQIKLLSSDDQWMYAPIAYNGMDLGLNATQSERRNGRLC